MGFRRRWRCRSPVAAHMCGSSSPKPRPRRRHAGSRPACWVRRFSCAARQGANILVLTTWVNHLDAITRRLCGAGCEATVLRGGMKARERLKITQQLVAHQPDGDFALKVAAARVLSFEPLVPLTFAYAVGEQVLRAAQPTFDITLKGDGPPHDDN